ncbi:MAG: CatB-related O-acetyltransferase [Planctomycetes bacterium]|nr:CatB-related O-acetyltransferase [Planctomycetota bacterium]
MRRRFRPRTVPVLSALLYRAYWLPSWRWQGFVRWLLHKLEGGSVYSVTLRRLFREQLGVEVGLYTHGGWTRPFQLDSGTVVGRYCSIAETARTITHNHPLRHRSTSGLFFHPFFGLARGPLPATRLEIGNDVWIGHNAIVLPSVRRIGDGAVVGAGAVVHRDVPPFAIVTGQPARVVGYRFSQERIAALLAEKWWDRPLHELAGELDRFEAPLDPEPTERDAPMPHSAGGTSIA